MMFQFGFPFGEAISDIRIIYLWLIFLQFGTKVLSSHDDILTKKEPGLFSPQKAWWTKEVTPDLYVAGYLSRRQILYAAEAGFKSIVSLFWVNTEDAAVIYGEYRPSSMEADEVATKTVGIQYATVLGPNEDDDWASIKTVDRLGALLSNLTKPVLLHCCRGFTIAVVSMLYLARETRQNPEFRPRVNSEIFYNKIASLGYDITCLDFIKDLVSEVTGEPIPNRPHCPQVDIEEWMDYWEAYPVYKNWFVAGQIRATDLPTIQLTGFKSVINFRQGTSIDGTPSQEAVTLLNVKDATPTFDENGNSLRQNDANLLEIRINASRENSYISDNCEINYQRLNRDEFGDQIGYNETIERKEVQKINLTYFHIPIGLLVEEARVPDENHRGATITCQLPDIVNLNCGTHRVRVVDDMRTIDVQYATARGVIVPLPSASHSHHVFFVSDGRALDVQYGPELFGKYEDSLLKLGKSGPVLLHCDTGKRATYMGVLASAKQYNKGIQWALKKLEELGFGITRESHPDIYTMYTASLNQPDKDMYTTIINKDEL